MSVCKCATLAGNTIYQCVGLVKFILESPEVKLKHYLKHYSSSVPFDKFQDMVYNLQQHSSSVPFDKFRYMVYHFLR